MKVPEAFALPHGADETPDVAGATLVGVLAPADGVGEAALLGVLAPADGVGEAAVVADVPLPATPAGAAAAFPACDDSPQPATTASRVADTALANAKRHRRRGCEAGIEELSFDQVSRSADFQWSGSPERLPTAPRKFGGCVA
jgi:hypothetical protein